MPYKECQNTAGGSGQFVNARSTFQHAIQVSSAGSLSCMLNLLRRKVFILFETEILNSFEQIGECRDYVRVWTLKENEYQDYVALKAACKKAGTPFNDPEFDPDDTRRNLIGNVELLTTRSQFPKWDGTFHWKRPSVRFRQF